MSVTFHILHSSFFPYSQSVQHMNSLMEQNSLLVQLGLLSCVVLMVIMLIKITIVRSSIFATQLSIQTEHKKCSSILLCAVTRLYSTSSLSPALTLKMQFLVEVQEISGT